MSVDYGDIFVLIGAGMLLAGLYLFDWRLALVGGGILLLFTGVIRLLYNYNRPE